VAKTIARGPEVWAKLKDIKGLLSVVADVGGGHRVQFQPMTPWGNFVFLTSLGADGVLYIQGNELKTERPDVLFRNEGTLGGMVRRALESTTWVIPTYRVLVYFMVGAFGGAVSVAVVEAASVAVFFSKHQKDIGQGLDDFKRLADALQKLFRRCPKLAGAMLCVALQEVSGRLSAELRQKGFVKLVIDHVDWQRSGEEAAEFFGKLLKFMAKRGDRKLLGVDVVGHLAQNGMVQLAKVASALLSAYEVMKLGQQAGRAVPRVADPQRIVTGLTNSFASAGVKLSSADARGIVNEGGLSQPEVRKLVTDVKAAAEAVDRVVASLSKAAQSEIF
jgi:hypothetical protein